MNKKTLLKVENLSVKLDGEEIIQNLSFEVKEGETLAILGPNGAGKTTLLRALLGVIPFEGKIEWCEGIKIGYVPQRLPFIKDIPYDQDDEDSMRRYYEKLYNTKRLFNNNRYPQ